MTCKKYLQLIIGFATKYSNAFQATRFVSYRVLSIASWSLFDAILDQLVEMWNLDNPITSPKKLREKKQLT